MHVLRQIKINLSFYFKIVGSILNIERKTSHRRVGAKNDFLSFTFYPENTKGGTLALTSHGIFVVMAFFMVSSLLL